MESFCNEIASICTFNVKKDPLLLAFSELGEGSEADSLDAYGRICALLLSEGRSLGDHLHDMLIFSQSDFIAKCARKPSALQKKAVECDLRALSLLAGQTSKGLKKALAEKYGSDRFLAMPDFETGKFGYTADYFLKFAAKNGSGIFAKYKAFTYSGGALCPIESTDPIRLSGLKNYEAQRDQVVENTLCFLKGKPAQNVLLYGDRGTGKSSTVKAILNEYDALRMVEIAKSDITELPALFRLLKEVPLRFIVMIDDLSFAEDDERFGILKAALEGSLSARPENILIYATTNRRKIIRETSAGRSDDLSRTDAVDESMSLADRFGLFITFTKPDKAVYLDIVGKLAKDMKIDLPQEELFSAAERFAIKRGGRSPRTARQFVESVSARLALGMEI